MVGRELVLRKEAPVNLREIAARTTLREVRQKGHEYVELRHVGKRIIFFCTLCLTPCYSDTVLFDHLQGNFHSQRFAAAKATLFGATPWPFNDGVLFFDSSRESNSLLSHTACQNDRALVVSNSSRTNDEVTSMLKLNSLDKPHITGCNKSNGSTDANVRLAASGRKTSVRSNSKFLDMISRCNWLGTRLIIPRVLHKDQSSDLGVRHLGVGQIACRIHKNKEIHGKITKIWCAWFGEADSDFGDEFKVLANCDFAIINFPYVYGLGRKSAPDDEDPTGSFFEVDDSGHRRKRKKKSFSDQEEYSDNVNMSCESPSEDSVTLREIVAEDSQHLERRLISSKVVRRELRKRKRLAAERTCDICGQPILPGKDVATLLNVRTGNLACSSRNTNGAFHPFHASCLIHWILLCESEILADQKTKMRVTRGRKSKSTLKNQITSIFCPECQGTGVCIQGDELEKPTTPLSEMFLYKLKALAANKAWMKHPETLQNCSTGLHFPSVRVENLEENLKPLKLLHFFRADD
ncbi:uncharacterized protein LOC122041475 [Zingiber officinale]|nr:uncharacterized protein LOC122041475 [Zingiber officinale]